MILLQASQITKSYGANTILSGVTLTVQSGQRIGLVGVNGAGKSTLLKILAGELHPDAGEIIKPKDITVGYLSQDGGLDSKNSIYQELLSAFQPLIQMEAKLREMETDLSSPAVISDDKKYRRLLDHYSNLSETFKEKGGYSYRAAIRNVMHGLNLNKLGADTKIQTLSGGQKTLVALAKLLLQSPDVLMLDEPTNYLDINTLNWLEQYLKSYPGALLIVSHDRYMLDAVANFIYELEYSKGTVYRGNYSQYLEQKSEQIKLRLKQHKEQMDEIARLRDFVQKNIVRAATSKRAQSRRRQLEKMEVTDKPREIKKASFKFNIKHQSGREVIKARNLTIGYRDKILSSGIDFLIEREERVALMGPNGVGKSTLLKTLIGQLEPLSGDIKYGTKVKIAYYEQEQAKLTANKQVLHELWDAYPQMTEKDIRTALGNFLFSGEDVKKMVSDLSGGEKARLALAKVMLSQANFLILDEPTNHLDIYSREVLENALIDFPGTILFVSHDRYFVNKIATRVLELNRDGVTGYLGNYDYYVFKKQQLQPYQREMAETKKENKKQKDKQKYLQNKEIQRRERKRQRRIKELEQYIKDCEEQIAKLEKDLLSPEVYQDHNRCLEVNNRLDELKTKLDDYLSEWVELEEQAGTN
ncbi:ATP-binding cassette subfamily F protein 3 [Desulfohalotomaculum tongense]|uniref:ABC-F family ATP-binding cassette domain-containing protein n=1 Tax=Desulforadius tongensis TaxID=1216062 RepID=UPI0019588CE7|nr:ABC-F family ATP-binding cassette domain-containing protein [Desulforadius tongensis]MBM7855944.1 ATP-binding cassette subfamily F protein 3 [Desulforadius tongensis]